MKYQLRWFCGDFHAGCSDSSRWVCDALKDQQGCRNRSSFLLFMISVLVIIGSVRIPGPVQVTRSNILFSFTLWVEAAAGKVKVAWRDIEIKWLEGKPRAIIQMSAFFFSFNFGSIKLDVQPSAVRHLIKYLSGCTSCLKPVWNSNAQKQKRLSDW